MAGSIILYCLVSVIELIAWIFYLTGDLRFFTTWSSIVGYYGSVALYIFPWLSAMMHVLIAMGGNVSASPGGYVVFLIVTGMLIWIINAAIHIAFVQRLQAYGNANKYMTREIVEEVWVCDLERADLTDEEYDLQCAAIKLATVGDETLEDADDLVDDDNSIEF
jgi:hypothetical protein